MLQVVNGKVVGFESREAGREWIASLGIDLDEGMVGFGKDGRIEALGYSFPPDVLAQIRGGEADADDSPTDTDPAYEADDLADVVIDESFEDVETASDADAVQEPVEAIEAPEMAPEAPTRFMDVKVLFTARLPEADALKAADRVAKLLRTSVKVTDAETGEAVQIFSGERAKPTKAEAELLGSNPDERLVIASVANKSIQTRLDRLWDARHDLAKLQELADRITGTKQSYDKISRRYAEALIARAQQSAAATEAYEASLYT